MSTILPPKALSSFSQDKNRDDTPPPSVLQPTIPREIIECIDADVSFISRGFEITELSPDWGTVSTIERILTDAELNIETNNRGCGVFVTVEENVHGDPFGEEEENFVVVIQAIGKTMQETREFLSNAKSLISF